ncbi:transposase family protein [Streptosporangium minutum]|uniref:transposase family protein n=1 Tax=Streptosporangium minutum TaxID=569862 RepID=UPI001A990842|nr:transposase family protein [Streptosporangium minutum]
MRTLARAIILKNRRITGLSVEVIAQLVAEIGPLWQARHQAALAGRLRRRNLGAGAEHKLMFVDRLLATLVHLRHGVTHDVLGCRFGVDRSTITRSTITRAIHQIRPLPADRGCSITTGQRLRTSADVIAYLGDSGQEAILDATEIRVRRPAAGTPERDRFVSGKSRMNTMKTMVLTNLQGELLFCGETRPGSVADITQARRSGLVDLLADTHGLQILADAGYQGLNSQTAGQILTSPRKRRGRNLEHVQWLMAHHDAARHAHSSRRIPVEHGIAHLKLEGLGAPPRPPRPPARNHPRRGCASIRSADCIHPAPRTESMIKKVSPQRTTPSSQSCTRS